LLQTHGPYHKGTRITQNWLVIAQYRASVNPYAQTTQGDVKQGVINLG